jgi:hypothetical protein
MNKKGSFRHYCQYTWKETGFRIMSTFTAFMLIIFIPAMYAVDSYNSRSHPFVIGSAPETSKWVLIVLGILWPGVIIYTIVKYRKYIKT